MVQIIFKDSHVIFTKYLKMTEEYDLPNNNEFEVKKLSYLAKDKRNEHQINYLRRKQNDGRWTEEEHNIFISEILRIGIKNWKKV